MTEDRGPASGPLKAACAELQEARDRVTEWTERLAGERRTVSGIETSMGEAALTAGDAGEIASRLAEARAAEDVTEAALEQAMYEVVHARGAVIAGRIAELYAEAAALNADADQHHARTLELLAQLSEWEDGAVFVAVEPWMLELKGASLGGCRIPKTTRLRNQAAGLLARADKLERQAAAATDDQHAALADRIAAEATRDTSTDTATAAA
ncbi:hypothetical protein [Actinomadura sp. NTSP31]|uniref:hypothetical protein n=1 Tax=Actinomadura sp. NTSP31 TaxID=1735447 RepID=UPI0035C2125E